MNRDEMDDLNKQRIAKECRKEKNYITYAFSIYIVLSLVNYNVSRSGGFLSAYEVIEALRFILVFGIFIIALNRFNQVEHDANN